MKNTLKFLGLFATCCCLSIGFISIMFTRWLLTPILGDATDDLLAMWEEVTGFWQTLGEEIIDHFR